MNCEVKKLDTIINLIDTNYFNKTTGALTIPNGIEEIYGKFYFRRKNKQKLEQVKKIILPNSVNKIGKYAFRRTGISEIEIPSSVKEIELGAFELCENLISVQIQGNKVPLIEKDAFIVCKNLERFANSNGEIDVKKDFRVSNFAFSTCYKLLNSQNKWLLVIPEKENKLKKYLNKLARAIEKVFTFNGMEDIRNKF